MPVAINTFGSYWRVNQALGSERLSELADRVQQLARPELPTTLIEKMKKLPELIKLASSAPQDRPQRHLPAGHLRRRLLRPDQAPDSNAGRTMASLA